MDKVRDVIFFGSHFDDFYQKQSVKVRDKIDYVIYLLMHFERISEKFMKHIDGTKGLYELRIEVGSNIFRIFCCFDRYNVVVLLNGFQKKTQKTPGEEIKLAARLRDEYFNSKKK